MQNTLYCVIFSSPVSQTGCTNKLSEINQNVWDLINLKGPLVSKL